MYLSVSPCLRADLFFISPGTLSAIRYALRKNTAPSLFPGNGDANGRESAFHEILDERIEDYPQGARENPRGIGLSS